MIPQSRCNYYVMYYAIRYVLIGYTQLKRLMYFQMRLAIQIFASTWCKKKIHKLKHYKPLKTPYNSIGPCTMDP